MLLKDFVQSVGVISHFLTTYARIFRTNILASPHWFLQMLCDCVIGIIDRLSSGTHNFSPPSSTFLVISDYLMLFMGKGIVL